MATTVERITAAIQAQRDEITRLRASTKADLDRSQARLDELLALRADMSPAIEAVLVRLVAAGLEK